MQRSFSFTFFTIVSIFILLSLGSWQVYRLHWKNELIAHLRERLEGPLIAIQTLENNSQEQITLLEYTPILAEGYFLHSQEYKLLGRTLASQAGYHLITPLRLTSKKLILVDRGWVPLNESGIDRPSGLIQIKGFIRLSSDKNFFTPKNNLATRELYSVNPLEFRQQTPLKDLLPFYICVSETHAQMKFPVCKPTNINIRNFHLVYALTWYSLALGIGILYLLYRKKNPQSK